MVFHWWQLAGPGRYVQLLLDRLGSGINVFACLPPWAPEGLNEWVRKGLSPWGPGFRLEEPQSGCTGFSLLDLSSRVLGQAEGRPSSFARLLHESTALASTILWIRLGRVGDPSSWIEMLRYYADICRSKSPEERCTICIEAVPEVDGLDIAEDVALAVLPHRGYSDSHDMAYYLHCAQPPSEEHPVLRQVRIGVAASLAGTDSTLGARLAALPCEELLEPAAALALYLRDTGFAPGSGRVLPDDCMGGQSLIHSASLMSNRRTREIEQRIWAGQVGVLFPFLERNRTRLVAVLSDYLTAPFETDNGHVINRIEDLELAHMLFMVRKRGRPKGAIPSLQVTTEMRRLLAHLKPVPARCIREAVETLENYLGGS